MKKKLLALLLTLCLVLGLFPIGVLAAPAEPGAVEATKTATYNPETDEVTITLSVQGKDAEETVTEENPVDVVLVVDNSGSMDEGAMDCDSTSFHKYGLFGLRYQCDKCGTVYWKKPDTCGGSISKMSAAKKSAYLLMDKLGAASRENRLALVGFTGSFGGEQNETLSPSTWTELNSKSCYSLHSLVPESEGVKGLMQAISDMDAGGGTNYTAGLGKAQSYLDPENNQREKYVIFISDGTPGLYELGLIDYPNKYNWNGTVQAADLKKNGVQIYTIGLGLGDKTEYLYRLASEGEGYTYNLDSEQQINEELPALIEKIATKISTVTKPAGTSASFVDEVSGNFTVNEQTVEGLSFNGNEVTWDVGTITEEPKTISFTVTPKYGVCGDSVETNTGATLRYTDAQGKSQTKTVANASVKLPSSTLTYNLNGGEGSFNSQTVRTGETVTVSNEKPTKSGFDFTGWKVEGTETVVAVGTTITMSSDVTLIAQYEEKAPTEITFTYEAGEHGS